jgi:serine/threonine protein kinase/Tol biopolymer transport system component
MIGQLLGHYRIESKLGEGGMGVVYKARDMRLDRPAAIKVLRAEAATDPTRKIRFVHEAKTASALNHPNIVHIYDIDTVHGLDFIAMEYVPGKTVDQLIRRKGMELRQVLRYAIQIADALAKAHAAGIVHRDLKPANVMITDEGLVKVLDFGLAKLTERAAEANDLVSTQTISDQQRPRTAEGTIVGTVAYMSPEQAEGKPVDARSDIFSFGSLVYEMVTGQRAFQGETKMSTLSAILSQEPWLAGEVTEGVPRELEKIISRCLRKDPQRRIRDMHDVRIALEELKDDSESGRLSSAVAVSARVVRRFGFPALLAAVLLGGAAVGGVWWWSASRTRLGSFSGNPILTRITWDAGLTTDPALSPDGKLLAYASDRAEEGNLDIWVKQVAGGEPIRLTHHPAEDSQPTFSPDGSKIIFHSQRDGGGVYVTSALGGEERLVATLGQNARFSPDGKWIAYSVGFWSGQGALPSEIYLMPAAGGSPKRFRSEFAVTGYPVWSPDGKFVMFLGVREPNTGDETLDWWVAAPEAGQAVRTGALAVFKRNGLRGPVVPDQWTIGNTIIFSASLGDSTNLWQVSISPKTYQITGPLRRLTFGTSNEARPSVALGPQGKLVLAFSSLTKSTGIWTLPLDANQGKVTGSLQRLTEGAAGEYFNSLSADGKKIAFVSSKSGTQDVWVKDLRSGKETALTQGQPIEDAWLSADGSKVAYGVEENQASSTHVVSSSGGVAAKICEDCGPLYWSSDGTRLLYFFGRPARVGLLDLASGQKKEILMHPQFNLFQVRFSSDDRWISFHATISSKGRQVFIAPFREQGPPVPANQWIPVTDGSGVDIYPSWSPDGNLLYFFSDRDGFRCLWAQRLDRLTKRPAGSPLAVYHFHRSRQSPRGLGPQNAVARDKVVLSLVETTGNIWTTTLEGQE